MNPPLATAFLFDVDNTLLDNDRIKRDFGTRLDQLLGADSSTRYWQVYEQVRDELGYADYLGTLQRCWDSADHDPAWLPASAFMLDCPFAEYLYPGALEALAHLGQFGTRWIVTDGEAVFQPHKVRHSGLWQAIGGRVLVYRHKQHELADIDRRCGADRYVMIDDKLRLLDAMKRGWGERLTTVWVRQGHYGAPADAGDGFAPADITIDHIHHLTDMAADAFGATVEPKETP